MIRSIAKLLLGLTAVVGLALMHSASAADDPPQPPAGVWTIDQGLSRPESAHFDFASKHLFISNVAGAPTEKNGQGYITKADARGNVIQAKWVTGLNAPKGLRAAGGVLWTADIDEVVAIDIASGKINERVPIDGAKFLNDVAIDNDGVVYVSDMLANRIYRIAEGRPAVFAEGEHLESPNGLLVHDRQLIVAAWGTGIDPSTFGVKTPGRLYALDLKTKDKTLITPQPLGNLDGVENDGSGGYFVSDWVAGKVYRISAEGEAAVILQGFRGAADLGIVEGEGLLLVPRMLEDKVTAYDVN
jgi:sugar lactone lactonase YvrE